MFISTNTIYKFNLIMMVNINRLFLINKKNKNFNFFYSAEKTMKNKIIIIIKKGGSSLFKENGMRKI